MTWNELIELYKEIGNRIPALRENESASEYYARLLVVMPNDDKVKLLRALFKDQFEALNDLNPTQLRKKVLDQLYGCAFAECVEFLRGLQHG